jgi:hypothetical protein
MRNGQPTIEEIKFWERSDPERHCVEWNQARFGNDHHGFSTHCYWLATTTAIVAAAVSAAAGVAGTVVAVTNANKAADAAEKTSEYNAKIDEQEALAARQAADLEAKQLDRRNRLMSGQQRAAYGKAGVDLSAGDDVLFDSGLQGEMEVAAARYAGEIRSNFSLNKASGSIFAGKNAASAARAQGTGAIISGVGGVAGSVSSGTTAYYGAQNRAPSFNKSPGGSGYSPDFYSRGPQ